MGNQEILLGVLLGASGMIGFVQLLNIWKKRKDTSSIELSDVVSSPEALLYHSPDPYSDLGFQEKNSDQVTNCTKDNSKESEALLNLLYSIGESQMKRENTIHRGISCNVCNSNPLTGVRFKCVNCVDYDVCSVCEPVKQHDITHVFVKIPIPIPPLANPRTSLLSTFYPGKTSNTEELDWQKTLALRDSTHFDASYIEVLHEQYKSLCSHEMGISKDVFSVCLGPLTAKRNLVVEQLFHFYDQDKDGYISFQDFVHGMSVMARGSKNERIKYVFRGYDLDGDGFISKDDLHEMLKAYHQLSMELVRDVVRSCEEEMMATYDDSGNRPISAVFNAPIPDGGSVIPMNSKLQEADLVFGQHSRRSFTTQKDTSVDRSSAVEAMTQDAICELVEQIMNNADLDHDGKLSEEEFQSYVLTDPSLFAWFESIDTVF